MKPDFRTFPQKALNGPLKSVKAQAKAFPNSTYHIDHSLFPVQARIKKSLLFVCVNNLLLYLFLDFKSSNLFFSYSLCFSFLISSRFFRFSDYEFFRDFCFKLIFVRPIKMQKSVYMMWLSRVKIFVAVRLLLVNYADLRILFQKFRFSGLVELWWVFEDSFKKVRILCLEKMYNR